MLYNMIFVIILNEYNDIIWIFFSWFYNLAWYVAAILLFLSLSAMVILNAFQGLSRMGNWKEAPATLIGHTQIQERQRMKRQEFFFKTQYLFTANDQRHQVNQEFSYPNKETARSMLDSTTRQERISVWYISNDPDRFTFIKKETEWKEPLTSSGFLTLILIFSGWLYRKISPK